MVDWSVGQSVGRSVGQLVRGKSYEHHAASTVSSPGPDFPNPSTPCEPPPKRPLILVGPSVGRSQGSHMNVTLPLQFCHPGAPFPILLRPAGHPQNGLKFWSIGRSVGQGEVTRTSHCLFSFVTRACPSRPFYPLQATPKTALNFGRSVGWSVGWSVGRSVGHGEVT